jgi:hypothetical protein
VTPRDSLYLPYILLGCPFTQDVNMQSTSAKKKFLNIERQNMTTMSDAIGARDK